MKKLYYLLALFGLAIASCNPMSDTYKKLDANPAPGILTYTLQPADYKLVPTSLDPNASKALGLTDTSEANKDIPGILNIKFPGYANGSNASITYASPSVVIALKLVDSSYTKYDTTLKKGVIDTAVIYTLTNDDYLLLPGNKYTDFSAAQLLSWLPYKYANAKNGTLKVLTWTPYPATLTVPSAFLYINGSWRQISLLTPTQYAAVGHGTYNEFTSADDANIGAYLNQLLKADLSVAATAKKGDIKYVSYFYYVSSTATYQKVATLYFDGTNWTTTPVPVSTTSTFVKSGGSWAPDPTVYYTLSLTDAGAIAADASLTVPAGDPLRTALGKYGDFEAGWTNADISNGIINDVLKVHYTTPKINVKYVVTYLSYSGGKDVPLTMAFTNDGTKWALYVPK